MSATITMASKALADMIAASAVFDPAAVFVGVATNIMDKGALTSMTDVTEATGKMATREAVTTWGAPYMMNDGRAVVDSPNKVFAPLDATEQQVLTHFFLADAAAAGNLLYFEVLPEPAALADENDHLTVVIRLTVDPAGRWSASVSWNG
jgi:hypothetical protein